MEIWLVCIILFSFASVLLLVPGPEGTEVQVATSQKEINDLLEGGLSIADVVLFNHQSSESLEFVGHLISLMTNPCSHFLFSFFL
jgi:hypothetical protein